jgi:hypothetical protein
MELVVGQIISRGIVVRQEIAGRFWFVNFENNGIKYEAVLYISYVPSGFHIERSQILQNLVILKCEEKYISVALTNYFTELSEYYYKKSSPTQIIKSKWDWWYNSFDRKKNDMNYNKKIEVTKPQEIVRRNPVVDFYELKFNNYTLPIIGYKDLDKIEGQLFFYPATTYRYRAGRSVYRGEELIPKIFMGKVDGYILNQQKLFKPVRTILHGFTSPAKWHYGVWKHLIKEDELREILKIDIQNISDNIFSQCKQKERAGRSVSCDESYCVDNRLFKRVHKQIKLLCDIYQKHFVAFFQADATRRLLEMSFTQNASYKLLQMGCFYEVTKNSYLKFVFRGICYNWDEKIPTLHFHPLTLYTVKEINPLINEDNSICFFKGNLIEIENEKYS